MPIPYTGISRGSQGFLSIEFWAAGRPLGGASTPSFQGAFRTTLEESLMPILPRPHKPPLGGRA